MKKPCIIFLISCLAACSTVTISPPGAEKISSQPNYQNSEPFFLWGLVGETRVNTKEVCNGEEPVQMQSQATFGDGLITNLTLGLYSPHSVKVWCEKGE